MLNELDILFGTPLELVCAVQACAPRQRIKQLRRIKAARPDLQVYITQGGNRCYHIAELATWNLARGYINKPKGTGAEDRDGRAATL